MNGVVIPGSTGMDVGAASYTPLVGGIHVPKHVVMDLYTGYHCKSVMSKLARPDFLQDVDMKCFSEVIYPILEDDDCEDCGQFQQNGRSEELPYTIGHRSVRICNNWRFHKKLSRGDYARMCSSEDLFKTAMQQWLDRRLDRKVDGYGLAVLVGSAAQFNSGRKAGMRHKNIDLGDKVTPWNVTEKGFNRLVNNMLTVFDEADVTCDNPHLTLVVPPLAMAKLREEQQVLNVCCGDDNAMVTGMVRHSYGINVMQSNRLPVKRVGNRTIYYIVAVDNRKVGAPSDLLYMDWQIDGHDIALFGEFIWDTFVFDPRGVVVGAIVFED